MQMSNESGLGLAGVPPLAALALALFGVAGIVPGVALEDTAPAVHRLRQELAPPSREKAPK